MAGFDQHPPLYLWPRSLKYFLLAFLFLLTSGVTTGLVYLYSTTSWSASGTIEHYNGSKIKENDLIDYQEKYPKSISNMLLTTHNHWIGFSFIFFFSGIVFYFSSTIKDGLKSFLLTEPFISSWLTFASIWAMRFIHEEFIYLAIVSAIVTYLSFYFIATMLFYELAFKNKAYKY